MRNSPSLALTARDLFGSDLSDLDDGPNDFLPDDNETDNGGDTGLDDSGALASSRFGSFSRVDLLDDDTNPSVKQEGGLQQNVRGLTPVPRIGTWMTSPLWRLIS